MWAQEFTATVDRNNIGVTDVFKITFTLEGSMGRNFKPPVFIDFEEVNHAKGNQMTIKNGVTTYTSTYSYHLRPLKAGTFTIPPATVVLTDEGVNFERDDTIRSNSVTIMVLDVETVEEPANDTQPKNPAAGSVFVKVILDKESVNVGEELTVSFKLYTSVAITNTSWVEKPTFEGCEVREVELPTDIPYVSEVYQDVPYKTFILKEVVLTPLKSGKLIITPAVLETTARVKVEKEPTWIDMIRDYEYVTYRFNSDTTYIHVQAK